MLLKIFWILTFIAQYDGSITRWLEVRLPNVIQDEGQLCTFKRIPFGTSYALKFIPQVVSETVERIVLYGCSTPHIFKSHWDCSPKKSICENEDENYIFYSWTRNIPNFEIPENVGFKLGGDMKVRYIVMQITYNSPGSIDQVLKASYPNAVDDSDGVDVFLSKSWQKYLAGMYFFSSSEFSGLPFTNTFNIDIGCVYRGKKIAPFAYSCIGDKKDGKSVLAYRVRSGVWSLISVANPHDPLGFYSIPDRKMMVIKPGDFLALRCIFNVHNDLAGQKNKSENCNFYFMYYMLNRNVPSHQYEEKCETLIIKTPLEFPVDKSVSSVSVTPPHNTLARASINQQKIIADVRSKNILISTSAIHNSTSYVYPSILKKTHFPVSIDLKKHTNKIIIDAKYFGPKPTLVGNWMVNIKNNSIGYMCSISFRKKKEVVILLSGSRNLTLGSFDDEHYYTDYEKPIKENTIIHVDSISGEIIKSFGNNIFYLPHSITIDHKDNYWITDIALHQVLKLNNSNIKTPALTLGIATIPGKDDKHFCKPTDVAVDKYNNVFVADGLCNSRIMKYDQEGKLVLKWGSSQNGVGKLKTSEFITPHSLSIDNKLDYLYVSDLQTGNILKFDLNGIFVELIKHLDVVGKLFVIDYNHAYDGILYTISGLYEKNGVVGHIISASTGKILVKWSFNGEISCKPKDIIISPDNTVMFLLINDKILKFSIHNPQGQLPNIENVIADGSYYSEIKIIKPIDNDKSILPAVIVVTILAIPVLLALITMLLQYFIRKYRHNKVSMLRMKKHRLWNSSSNEILCYGCCITRKHYYDGNHGIDDFISDSDESDCDEEDLFTGKA